MADIVDMASVIEAEHLQRNLARAIAPIPAGVAGECDGCFEDMPRLVGGLCGFCRDGRPNPGSQPTPSSPTEESPVPGKSIMLPESAAFAIEAVETRAAVNSVTFGTAAAELIVAGAGSIGAPPAEPTSGAAAVALAGMSTLVRLLVEHGGTVDELVADLVTRANAGTSRDAEVAGLVARAVSAEDRATAAEGKLQSLREALAA